VTESLRAKVSGNRLEIANPGAELTDPAVGVHKTLAVAYAIDGEVRMRLCRDDRPFSLPEGRPASEAPTELWKAELPSPPTAASVGFSGDGKLAFLGGEDGVVRYLDAASGKELGHLEDTGGGRVDAIGVSPAGSILVARAGRPVRLWPSKTSKQPIALGDYKEAISALAISPKGDQAATGSWDRTARLWDLRTGRQVRQFLGNEAVVMGVDFSVGGRQLVTTSWDGTARTWDTSTGAQNLEYEGDNGQLGKSYASKDGKFALFVSDRGSLITLDLATGKVITRVVAPACTGWALALSPDARWMADAEENVVVLRDVTTLKVAARIERHFAQVKVLAFSPDSRALLTGGDDKVIRLWKLPEPRG
jgi:WD40 repeat protein